MPRITVFLCPETPVRRCTDGVVVTLRVGDVAKEVPQPKEFVVSDPALSDWFLGVRHRGILDVELDEADAGVVRSVRLRNVDRAVSVSPAPDLASAADLEEGFEDLMELAREMRAFAEEVPWPEWADYLEEPVPPPGQVRSGGMCRISTAMALPILREAFPDGDWQADGGHPTVRYGSRGFKRAFARLDGGMWDRLTNAWDGHYWIRGRHAGREVIVDISADQYGWAPVIVAAGDDPRYRASYTGATVRKDVGTRRVTEAAERWAETFRERTVPTP